MSLSTILVVIFDMLPHYKTQYVTGCQSIWGANITTVTVHFVNSLTIVRISAVCSNGNNSFSTCYGSKVKAK